MRGHRTDPPRFRSIDGGGEVEDVRAQGWLSFLSHPLTRRVKAAATLLGALAAISGYLAGAGRFALAWAGVATTKELDARALVAAEAHRIERTADEAVAKRKEDELSARLTEILGQQMGLAQGLQSVNRRLAKLGRAPAKRTGESREK